MKKIVKIKQRDITDCGAACLASIAQHYGLKLAVARIRQLASTDKKGTNVLGLIEAAEKLKFTAKGIKCDMSTLDEIPKPAIAHVIIKEQLQHFVVIYEVAKNSIKVMDPGTGEVVKHSKDEFEKIWTGVLVLLLPNETFETGNQRVPVVKRFFHLIRPHSSVLTQAIFGALIYTILGLSTSIYVQKIVDYVIVDGNNNLLNLLSVIMISLLLVKILLNTLKSIFILKTGQQMDATLILGYYKHLLKLPQQFFNTMRVGEIISRINDAVKIRAFINDVSINLIVNVFVVIFSFVLMFTYYWKLAVVMLLIIPIYTVIYFIINYLNKKVERKVMEHSAELESQLVESINGVATIKQFGLEYHANVKTETKFVQLLESVYKSGVNNIFSIVSTESVSQLFTIILLWVGAGYVLQNHITPGELLSFYAVIGYFTGPVSSLIGMNKTMQNAMIAGDRLFEIMDLELEGQDNQVKLNKSHLGDIQFKNVHFRYGSRETVFEGLDLHIPFGKVSAIVGESGSGKSTVVALLQKIHLISEGHIFIGSYDVGYLENKPLRKLIGVVPQQIDLFAGNLIDNIAIGDYEPDMEKILGICTNLGMIPFIEKLPNGLGTYIGENGVSLSGGQRQKLAIARALYKSPEILIFDEATSALDSASEDYVQKVIDEFSNMGKTVIIIAHRLSTICKADKIMVMEEGKILEEGTHDYLYNKQDSYYDMWKRQFPVFSPHLN